MRAWRETVYSGTGCHVERCSQDTVINISLGNKQGRSTSIDFYEEANKPTAADCNGETNRNGDYIQIGSHCLCGDGSNLSIKQRKSNDALSGHDIRHHIGALLLPRRFAPGHTSALRERGGLLWRRSLATPIFYVLLMTSSVSSANYYSDYVSLYMRNYSRSACDGEYLRIECPEGTSIDVQGAMYGRKVPSKDMCPSEKVEGSGGVEKIGVREDTSCEAKTGAECQDQRICRLLVHRRVFGRDPCPGTSKYLTVNYQCAPKDFQRQSGCVGRKLRLRCRQDTVISVFKVYPQSDGSCGEVNRTDCAMTKSDVFDELSAKCHLKDRCYYILPASSCFSRAVIIHTCVPKQFLTSELPTSERLFTTTTTTTTALPTTVESTTADAAETTEYSTTQETSSTTVQSTVKKDFEEKGDSFTTSTPTSKLPVIESATTRNILVNRQGNLTSPTVPDQEIRNTSFQVATDVTWKSKEGNDVVIHNEFPMIPAVDMGDEINETRCPNCTDVGSRSSSEFYDVLLRLYSFLEENREDILIAALLGVVISLLLVICVLVCRRKKRPAKAKERRETEETREDNRNSLEEHYTVPETEPPNQEDEHENMSLLGSLLQKSMDSNHASPKSNSKPGPEEEEEKDLCGPKSIFATICCNCCCSNAPWQRTGILKPRGKVYRFPHGDSSSQDDDDTSERFGLHEPFPVFDRTDDNVDSPSPIPILEDHINGTEYPVTVSETMTSPNVASQQSSDFRPVSANAHRHYSVTPEPDSQYRTQRSTFRPQDRPETQRSDSALNRYSVRPNYNVTQPLTAPTSPVINHRGNSNHAHVNGTHKIVGSYPISPPKTLPVMGQSMLQNTHNNAQTPQSPVTPKYTPPPNQYYGTQHYPTFTAIEQYDNAPPQNQMVVRRKQYPQRPQEFPVQSQFAYPRYNTHYPGYHHQNSYESEHFVQAVPRRNMSSNARTVDLAVNARTVDLSHDNSLSRNSWLEIRRESFYDNSLTRSSEMYEFYQTQLHQHEMQHALQLELPGSRNLNHYYP